MTRMLLIALLVLSLVIPVTAAGERGASPTGPQGAIAKKKKKKCKKGYVRKRVKIKRGKNKGKRVSKCVKRKKKAAAVLPTTTLGGVFAGGADPTELRTLFGYDSEAKPDEDSDGVSVRLTMPAGSMTCTQAGQTFPSDQPFRSSWEGTVTSQKSGTFRGTDSFGGVTRTMQGRFLPKRRIQASVSISGISAASSRGGSCTGSATRDVTYKSQPAGSFENP